MISYFQAILLAFFTAVAVFGAFYSGYYFGYQSKHNTPPEMPLDLDIFKPKKKQDQDTDPVSYYDH
jgi:hypothetical protein